MSEGYGGFRDMGSVLFGGADTQGAYNKGAQGAAELETLLAKARMAKDQSMKRAEFRQTLIDNGVAPEVASIADVAFGAGYNPENFSSYQLGQQKFGLTNEAAGLARDGNVTGMNNILSVIKGDPRPQTSIVDKTMFNAYDTPDQAVQTTPMGLADIVATQALGRARDASAAESMADVALRNRTDPNSRASGGGGRTGGAASNTLTPDVMEMFKVAPPRSPPGTPRVFDAASYQQFLADRSSMGGTGNISEDARAWFVRQNPETRKVPIIIDPTNPASMTRSPPAPMREPPAGAIQKLRANPNLRAQFDEWYGPGSAARALGGQ